MAMESFLEARPLGEESLQMWGLNKRLEAYLARVKFLEEENEGLKSQIHLLKGSSLESSWRGKCEEEVAALRAARDEALREKSAAELARASLYEEIQQVKSRCQKERSARDEAKQLLSVSKNELEEEKRSQLWLREKAVQLGKEMEALVEAHKEERAGLEQEAASFSWDLESFCRTPVTFQPAEVEDYSKRLSNIWRGAVETYKAEVSQLEVSFGEAKENLWKATESNRQNQWQLQQLERELAALKRQKETLEERLVQQWQHQQGEAEKLQLAVEQLEKEKQSLAVQIAQVLEDRQQLMHLKMSLSLEVATYRTLLEAESTRLQMPAEHRLAVLSSQDGKSEASSSKRPAVSPERGSQDLRPAFLKGSKTPQLPKNNPSGSFAATTPSPLPRSRRSAVQKEFQKATKAFDVPGPLGSAAFKLGSSPQKEAETAPQAGTASQSPAREPSPPFSPLSPTAPDVPGESSTDAEQSRPTGEESSAQREAEEPEEKAELYEGEIQPREETPWKDAVPEGRSSSQLATEAAFETALQEVCCEAGLSDVTGSPRGLPSEDEDRAAAAVSPSPVMAAAAAAGEEATRKLFNSQTEDWPSADPLEDSSEANSSQETCSEQAKEGGGWMSLNAEPPSPPEAELLGEEQSREEIAFGLPVTEEDAWDHETRALEGGHQQPPSLQSVSLAEELGEVFKGTESTSLLDQDAGGLLRGDPDSSAQLGTNRLDGPPGTTEADLSDTEGGVEDLEMMSTEALQLSEDEERRALSSPSREREECDLRTEMLQSEFPQKEEGFAAETLSPVGRSFYSAESHQDRCFLGVEQETSEEQTPLHKRDAALPEEVGKETDSEPEISGAEESSLSGEDHPMSSLLAEPTAVEGSDAEEGHVPEQDVWGHKHLFEEENSLGEEDTTVKTEITDQKMASLQDGNCEEATVLQEEIVGSVLKQEASEGELSVGSIEGCQEDLPTEQKTEEENITMESETLEREDLRTGSEAIEAEETEAKARVAEKEETTDDVSTGDFQEEETPEAKNADVPETEEQHIAAEIEETFPNQDSLYWGQSLLHETSSGASEVPAEAQNDTARGHQANSHSSLQEVDVSSESDHRLQSDCSGSEVSLKSLDVPPNVSCDTEGVEEELESSKQIKLEETLPDNTPLHLYDEMMSVLAGKGQPPAENEEAVETALASEDSRTSEESVDPSVEDVGPYSSHTKSDDAKELAGAEEQSVCSAGPVPSQGAQALETLLVSKELAEAELLRGHEDLPSSGPERPSAEEHPAQLGEEVNEQPGEVLKPESGAVEEPLCSEMTREETGSPDLVWETRRDHVSQAPEPSYVQEDVRGENDSPLGFSDPVNGVSAGSQKVSPLTSVAELGEIVLEGEQSPDGQKDPAYSEDKSLLRVHESQPISGLENCEREVLAQQTDVAELGSSGQDPTALSQKEIASLPIDTLKDSDILEIVEQALEFNQEFIRAAEQTVETEQLADVPHSTEAEKNCRPLALPDVGRVPETPKALFHGAKDPTGYGLLWAENGDHELQQNSSLADFTSEILNGIGALPSGDREHEVGSSREELMEEVAIEGAPDDPQATLETRNQSSPETRAHEEAPRTGEICSEIHQTVPTDHKGKEGLNVDKNLLVPVKGKGAEETETVSIPSYFGEEILLLESSQHQKFRAEAEEELWSAEDN